VQVVCVTALRSSHLNKSSSGPTPTPTLPPKTHTLARSCLGVVRKNAGQHPEIKAPRAKRNEAKRVRRVPRIRASNSIYYQTRRHETLSDPPPLSPLFVVVHTSQHQFERLLSAARRRRVDDRPNCLGARVGWFPTKKTRSTGTDGGAKAPRAPSTCPNLAPRLAPFSR
jgi:hypothetical protein